MTDSDASDGDHMIEMQTLYLVELQPGIGVRRHGHVDDDRYALVNNEDGSLVGRAPTRDQVAAELVGD